MYYLINLCLMFLIKIFGPFCTYLWMFCIFTFILCCTLLHKNLLCRWINRDQVRIPHIAYNLKKKTKCQLKKYFKYFTIYPLHLETLHNMIDTVGLLFNLLCLWQWIISFISIENQRNLNYVWYCSLTYS